MCERDGRFIKPCDGVRSILDDRKGVFLRNLVNFETGNRSSDRLVIQTGEWRKGGVALNVCPFMGTDLQTWLADPQGPPMPDTPDQTPERVAEIARLRGLLWFAWYEFNAIRARHGAPITHDGMRTCTTEWWSEMTEMFAEAIGRDALTPWMTPEAKAVLRPQPQEPRE